MNMSDNCSELCISVGKTSAGILGRSFTGVHGDGQLLANGNADVTGWAIPASAGDDYYIPRGMIFPSAGWGAWTGWSARWASTADQHNANLTTNQLSGADLNAGMISSRAKAAHGIAVTTRENGSFMAGIRCVRTAKAAK